MKRTTLLRPTLLLLAVLLPLGVVRWEGAQRSGADHDFAEDANGAGLASDAQGAIPGLTTSNSPAPEGVPFQRLNPVEAPRIARNLMPGGGQSLFWGTLAPRPGAAPLSFHFYALSGAQLQSVANSQDQRCRFALDVFRWPTKAQPRRINHVLFSTLFSWTPTTFEMGLTWLNPARRTLPVLKIKSIIDGMYGPLGVEHLVAFPRGWQGAATVNNLQFGAWHAAGVCGEENTLLLDRAGQLQVDVTLSPDNSELSPAELKRDYTFNLRWNPAHHKFEPHAANRATLRDEYDLQQ